MRTEFTKTVDAVMPYCAGLRHAIGDILTDASIPAGGKRDAITKAITGRFAEDILRGLPADAPAAPPQPPEPTSKSAKPEPAKAASDAPVDRLTKVVSEVLRADPKLGAEQAVTKAFEAEPAAYDAIETERQAMIRRRGALE